MQKPQTRNGATHVRKKRTVPAKGKDSLSLQRDPWGFACELCQLLASRHAETRNIKSPLDMTTLNLDLLTTGYADIFQRLL